MGFPQAKRWFFHTDDPATDLGERLNPHFDSLEGLSETEFFTTDPDGLDCVLEMSSGPFDLEVGEQVRLDNIFFELEAFQLKDASATELNKIIQFMESNPFLIIEL